MPRAEAEAAAPAAAPRLALFLGFGFDQFLLTLEFGSVAQFVSEAFGVPREHVYILRQWPCFDQLTVAGRSVTHCCGYRNLGDMGRRFVGTGLFLDPRPLGRPVCFREVGSPLLSPSQICLWLQVTTPNGYAPFCAGGSLPGSAAHSFLVNHGDTILVWIDCIQPPPSIASPVNDQDSAESTTDASDSDGDTRPDPASLPRPSATAAAISRNRRSRSPRCHRNGTPVSGALAAMWSDSTCDTMATSTCPCRLPLTVRARRQFLKSLTLQVLRLPLLPFLGSAARRFLACQCLNFPVPRRRPPQVRRYCLQEQPWNTHMHPVLTFLPLCMWQQTDLCVQCPQKGQSRVSKLSPWP